VGLVIAVGVVAALAFGLNMLWGGVAAQQARTALQARIAAAPVAGKIAFVQQIEEKVQICALDADGPDARCFTDIPVSALDPAWSPDGRRIVFTGLENEDQDIYVMDADGTHARNLTHRPGRDESPTWSPDGKQIAFVVDYYGRRGISVMDADGGNIRLLLDEPDAAHPAWSSDGKQIAFVAYKDQEYHIYAMDANSGNVRQIADGAGQPTWTPDSRRLAYLAGAATNEVYIVNADGTNPQRLLDQTLVGGAAWAPDGRRLAFVRNDLLYVADSAGANIRRLPNDHPNRWATPWAPAWAPDGRHLVFTMFPEKNSEIFMADAGGGNLRRLTNTPAGDTNPALSPDGRQIAFTSNRDGDRYSYDLYVMNSDGSDPHPLIRDSGKRGTTLLDSAPVWSPDGRHIAFVADYRVHVVDADGANLRDLGRSVAGGRAPSWAPDSRRLVFDSLHEIFVAGIDGGAPDSLLNAAWAPAWAPDGRHIAFISQRDEGPSVYLMDADGSHVRRLSATPATDQPPVWAPDSARLTFLSGKNSADQLCIIEADGLYERCLPKAIYAGEPPAWAPDGLRLAFATQGDYDRLQIHVVDADGENLHRLVDTPAGSFNPVWRP
jgi:Tol biopolymer transport system component